MIIQLKLASLLVYDYFLQSMSVCFDVYLLKFNTFNNRSWKYGNPVGILLQRNFRAAFHGNRAFIRCRSSSFRVLSPVYCTYFPQTDQTSTRSTYAWCISLHLLFYILFFYIFFSFFLMKAYFSLVLPLILLKYPSNSFYLGKYQR